MVALLVVSLFDRLPFEKPMLRQAKTQFFLTFFLSLSPPIAGAAVVEQLLVVINGEPYTLSSLNSYAKSKAGRALSHR